MSPPPTGATGASRPSTPAGLGLGGGGTNPTSTQRSVSSSSSTSLKGVAPCFHTTRPQFISSHIDRCEACRLKYARKAEQTTIPYSPLAARRPSVAPQNRSQSRQSVGGGSASMRPSSRASVVSAASRLQDTGRAAPATHHRSSSAGTPLADARANTKKAIARAAESALADDGSPPPALPSPPPRGDAPMAAASYGEGMPVSPTETVASRSRSRHTRNVGKSAAGAASGSSTSGAHGARRGQTQPLSAGDSPLSYIKAAQRPATALPSYADGFGFDLGAGVGDDDPGSEAVDLTNALMGTLVDRTRDYDKMRNEYEARISRLQGDIRRLRRLSARAPLELEGAAAGAAEPTNIFDPNSASAKQLALERTIEFDRAALDKFEEFRRAYEDCEPSLRSNRAQFAGERPLSPPPARKWGNAAAATPMHSILDNSEHDARLASFSAAEVRRAGEDLMSTPVRRKPQRALRGTSTRRPTRSRMARPLFSGESELSDDGPDDSDLDDDDDGEHGTLRNCLMSASNFGTFLVQYVTRQCLDFNMLCDENKSLMVRLDELEKRTAQLDKVNRRLEDARDEQVVQAYDMSAQREVLSDKVDAAERNARRLANENDKLKHDLATSNERGQALDDQVTKLNGSLAKARQRYEQEISGLRRSSTSLQQEKVQLTRKNDELRVELKGKLQRAGLKANVDEYLASRRSDGAAAGSGAAAAGAADKQHAGSEADGVAAESEIKRLQETVQFWRKKTDRISRKLRSEKAAIKEASRLLRTQQEETYRYQQMFGPLPLDEGLPETMESLGDYVLGMAGSARRGSALTVRTDASAADSDAPSSHDTDTGSKHSGDASDASAASVAGEIKGIPRMGSRSSLSSVDSVPAAVDEEADDQDIRRYEMRMKNRRTLMATPRNRRNNGQRAATTAAARRTRGSALTIDVGAGSPLGGESLGEILGTSGQWGDSLSARRRSGGGSRGLPTGLPANAQASLAAELGALDSGADIPPSSPLPSRSLAAGSPLFKPRSRSIRGVPSPFGEDTGVFGIGFGASVNLAEQFAAAAKRPSVSLDRPQTADASTSTDPLPTFAVAQVAAALPVSSEASVQAAILPLSADMSTGTANAEPGSLRSVGIDPLVSHAAFAEGASQTAPVVTSDVAVQQAGVTACTATETDPRAGMVDCGVGTAPIAVSREVQAGPVVASIGLATSVSAESARHAGVDSVARTAVGGVQAVTDAACAQMATDPLVGVASVSVSAVADVRDGACQSLVELAHREMATDRLEGVAHRGVEAVPAARTIGIRAGAGPLKDAETATAARALAERGSDALRQPLAEAGISAQVVATCDAPVGTDDAMLAAWLAPLVPDGVSMALVLAALGRWGRPVYEIHAEQVAEAARLADAERERLVALAADAAAAANAKAFANRGTGPLTATSEFGIQVEPRTAEKQHQAGLATAVDASTDAAKPPAQSSVAVATDRRLVDRWAEPLDLVARLDQAVAAGVEVADRATSHVIESTSTAVGPAFEQRDVSTSSAAATAEAATAAGGPLRTAAVDSTVEVRNQSVATGGPATAVAATSTMVSVADAMVGPARPVVGRATDGAVASSERCIETDAATTQAVGTSAVAVATDAATEPHVAGTADAAVSAAPIPSDAAMSTAVLQASYRSIGTGVSAPVLSTGTQAVPPRAELGVSAHSESAPVTAGALAPIHGEMVAADDEEASAAGDSLDEAMGAADGAALQPRVPRSRPPVPALALGAARSIRTPSPTIPLPPLPQATTSRSMPLHLGGGGGGGSDSAVGLNRLHNAWTLPPTASAPEKEESDGEDYGYIMVSPRTHVQHVPVPAISSARMSVESESLDRGEHSSRAMSEIVRYASSDGAAGASLGNRERGPSAYGGDECDSGDELGDDVEAARPAVGPLPGRFNTVRGIAMETDEMAGKRSSVSIGVEAGTHAASSSMFVRQLDPLIVQSIARTMVGANMWKYTPTRFANSTMRERRHQRYFWVQPYAKLLNWSKQAPSSGMGITRSSRENGGRSVFMREVRIEEEPRGHGSGSGEPSYVIVVRTDHREIKLKAMSQADHDQWYMALSYLQSRRIITSTTYPSATMAASSRNVAGYHSDDSLHSRETSMGSMDATQRVVLQADQRARRDMTERSRSRSHSRPRGPISGLLGRPPPPPPPQLPSSSVGSLETANDSYVARGALASSVSHASRDSSMHDGRGSISAPPLAHKGGSRRRPHRSTLDITPQRVQSLQTTPLSLRPVSMMPPVTPRRGDSAKRLSIGLFRKMGGSGTSLFRHGTQMSEEALVLPAAASSASPVPQAGSDESLQPAPSIAVAMMGGPAVQYLQADARGSVRKMFSGSFLRALRSRESVVEETDGAQ